MSESPLRGPLTGVKVLDLSRILAGPTATQLLGDLGADVVKVERPDHGDDTRRWGPPFVEGHDGPLPQESAYYLCANRNKRSIAIDLSSDRGQALVRRLTSGADVLIENYKVGALAQWGLDYETLRGPCPRLVYCSISGFGQTGPRSEELGYDFLVQAMGGLMSLTGEPEGAPMKAGVGIADVMCGMYATVAILAALRHRDHHGQGQHIDLALFDAQVAWLINAATNYLTSGAPPRRFGNGHPNIVPYQVFPTADGHVAIAAGNDRQFEALARAGGQPELAKDPRFATNAARVEHRDACVEALSALTRAQSTERWVERLKQDGVPCGPVQTVPEVLEDPQTRARQMQVAIPYPEAKEGEVRLLGNPLNFSKTPVQYERPPPRLGQHTADVLRDWAGMDEREIEELRDDHIV